MNQYDDTRPLLKLVGGRDYEAKKLGVPAQHRGVLFTRVLPGQHPQENTRCVEAGFVEEWSERNKEDPFLEKLLSAAAEHDPRREFVPRTRRKWEIAHLAVATIIQWLPTSVGCSFLRSAFERGGGDLKYRLPDWDTYSR
jgi:hypothetical protein